MGLGGSTTGTKMLVAPTYKRVARANSEGLLQVFLDENGVSRGYAIFALLSEEEHALGQSNPTSLADLSSYIGGLHPWLIALSAGTGHGLAVAIHIRDNFLRPYDRLTYVRQRKGKVKINVINGRREGFGRPTTLGLDTQTPSFPHLCSMADHFIRFYHYSRLLSLAPECRATFGDAIDIFRHSTALLQYQFDNDDRPSGFLCWAMLSDKTIAKMQSLGNGRLRASDWNSGTMPCIIQAIGEPRAVRILMDNWRARFVKS